MVVHGDASGSNFDLSDQGQESEQETKIKDSFSGIPDNKSGRQTTPLTHLYELLFPRPCRWSSEATLNDVVLTAPAEESSKTIIMSRGHGLLSGKGKIDRREKIERCPTRRRRRCELLARRAAHTRRRPAGSG